MHVANVEALRRSLARLELRPAYVLTDGFPVDGLDVPGLAMWKGDRVAACISAASVIAKVTRDRIMCELHEQYPAYDFATHKGYITEEHSAVLTELGPSPVHRMRFVNVRRAAGIIDPEPLSLEPQLELFDRGPRRPSAGGLPMSAEDLEKYETEMELNLYREYRDVVGIFKYVVETDRRFYLCNQVDVKARTEAGDVFFEVTLTDAWVWDMYRPARRLAKNVKVLTFKDVNVEELSHSEIEPPEGLRIGLLDHPHRVAVDAGAPGGGVVGRCLPGRASAGPAPSTRHSAWSCTCRCPGWGPRRSVPSRCSSCCVAPVTPQLVPRAPLTTPEPVHPENAASGVPFTFASRGGEHRDRGGRRGIADVEEVDVQRLGLGRRDRPHQVEDLRCSRVVGVDRHVLPAGDRDGSAWSWSTPT